MQNLRQTKQAQQRGHPLAHQGHLPFKRERVLPTPTSGMLRPLPLVARKAQFLLAARVSQTTAPTRDSEGVAQHFPIIVRIKSILGNAFGSCHLFLFSFLPTRSGCKSAKSDRVQKPPRFRLYFFSLHLPSPFICLPLRKNQGSQPYSLLQGLALVPGLVLSTCASTSPHNPRPTSAWELRELRSTQLKVSRWRNFFCSCFPGGPALSQRQKDQKSHSLTFPVSSLPWESWNQQESMSTPCHLLPLSLGVTGDRIRSCGSDPHTKTKLLVCVSKKVPTFLALNVSDGGAKS